MSSIGQYLADLDYSPDLVQAVEGLGEEDQRALHALLQHYDFGEREIYFMTDYPLSINDVCRYCLVNGAIDQEFMDKWVEYYNMTPEEREEAATRAALDEEEE